MGSEIEQNSVGYREVRFITFACADLEKVSGILNIWFTYLFAFLANPEYVLCSRSGSSAGFAATNVGGREVGCM